MNSFNLDNALTQIAQKHAESIEEWNKFQAEQREALKSKTDEDRQKAHGHRTVEFALKEIQSLIELGASDDEKIPAFERLAEGYALSGDYVKAVEFTQDDIKKAEYEKVLEAIGRDDNMSCPCPNLPNRQSVFLKDKFYEDTKYKQVVNLWKCAVCGFENARP